MDKTPPDFRGLIGALSQKKVEYILVGGLAAAVHGAGRSTFDLEILYKRDANNYEAIISALEPLHPRLRGAPKEIPFIFDAKTIEMGLNFTLTSKLGDIYLLGEITGGGSYSDLLPQSFEAEVFDHIIRVLDLAVLIHTKRAAGRPKDFEAIAELEILLDKQSRQKD